jgi:hypothetical protein
MRRSSRDIVAVVYSIDEGVYRAGDITPKSGVYRVLHDGHRADHPVVAIKGEVFPVCRKCQTRVRFRLWMGSEYVAHDWDLSGPLLQSTV